MRRNATMCDATGELGSIYNSVLAESEGDVVGYQGDFDYVCILSAIDGRHGRRTLRRKPSRTAAVKTQTPKRRLPPAPATVPVRQPRTYA